MVIALISGALPMDNNDLQPGFEKSLTKDTAEQYHKAVGHDEFNGMHVCTEIMTTELLKLVNETSDELLRPTILAYLNERYEFSTYLYDNVLDTDKGKYIFPKPLPPTP